MAEDRLAVGTQYEVCHDHVIVISGIRQSPTDGKIVACMDVKEATEICFIGDSVFDKMTRLNKTLDQGMALIAECNKKERKRELVYAKAYYEKRVKLQEQAIADHRKQMNPMAIRLARTKQMLNKTIVKLNTFIP